MGLPPHRLWIRVDIKLCWLSIRTCDFPSGDGRLNARALRVRGGGPGCQISTFAGLGGSCRFGTTLGNKRLSRESCESPSVSVRPRLQILEYEGHYKVVFTWAITCI